MTWCEMSKERPKLERIYLAFSPKWGYETLMWEASHWNRDLRWDDVTHWMAFDLLPRSGGCQCPACKVAPHASSCAVHNAPALPVGECDCGALTKEKT